MTEIFHELAVIAEPISDEDKVVYLLAGLPVTEIESESDTVPTLEMVTEWLLREEHKLREREKNDNDKKLLVAKGKKPFTSHYCKKAGDTSKVTAERLELAQAQLSQRSGRHKNPTQPPKKERQTSQDVWSLVMHLW